MLQTQTRSRSVHVRGVTTEQKTLDIIIQDWVTGRGPWAVGRGPWAVGRGPWAVGRGPRAAGPLGRWAAGLLLAKPGVPAELHLECSTKKLEYEHHEIVFGSTEDLT